MKLERAPVNLVRAWANAADKDADNPRLRRHRPDQRQVPGHRLIQAKKLIGLSTRKPSLMCQEMKPRPFVPPMYGREGIYVHATTLAPESTGRSARR